MNNFLHLVRCGVWLICLFSISAIAETYAYAELVPSKNETDNFWAAIDPPPSKNVIVYSNSNYTEIKSVYYQGTTENDINHWTFKIAGVELVPEDLGTPSQVDGSAPIATTRLENKDISAYCISIIRSLSGYSQNFHNNFVVYKINDIWRALNFSTPLTCKNSVSLSDRGLKIKYQVGDNTDERKPGYITKKLLLIDKNGKKTDSFVSKKHWSKKYQALISQ